jgi:hypothetical protein
MFNVDLKKLTTVLEKRRTDALIKLEEGLQVNYITLSIAREIVDATDGINKKFGADVAAIERVMELIRDNKSALQNCNKKG